MVNQIVKHVKALKSAMALGLHHSIDKIKLAVPSMLKFSVEQHREGVGNLRDGRDIEKA